MLLEKKTVQSNDKKENYATSSYEVGNGGGILFTKPIDLGTKVLQAIFDSDFDFRYGKIMSVTPIQGAKILKYNTDNRKVKLGHVKWLAKQQELGLWLWGGNLIAFGVDAVLENAQHQLLAQQDSGKTLIFMIISGFSKESMHVMDTGVNRTASDVLTLNGFPNATTQAACCKKVMSLEDKYYNEVGAINGHSGSRKVHETDARQLKSNMTILERCTKDKQFEESAYLGLKYNRNFNKIVSPSFWATMHYIMFKSRGGAADKFLTQVSLGVGLEKNSPAFKLRNRLISERLTTRKANASNYLYWFAYAWKCFINNKKCVLSEWEGDKNELIFV